MSGRITDPFTKVENRCFEGKFREKQSTVTEALGYGEVIFTFKHTHKPEISNEY